MLGRSASRPAGVKEYPGFRLVCEQKAPEEMRRRIGVNIGSCPETTSLLGKGSGDY